MPKYLTNSKFFDDGAGVHIENGFIQCLDLFINSISVEDLIQASIDLVDVEITALQNDVAAIQTTLTTCSYNSATQTFVVGNNFKVNGTFNLYISGVYYNINTFVTTTNNDIQTCFSSISTNSNNITNNTADIVSIKSTLTNVTYNSLLNAFQIGGTTDCRVLNTLYLYSSGSPYSVNTFVTNTNSNITSLINKTQDISYSAGLTTIEKLSFNTFINGTSKAYFDNIMTTCFDISGNCQTQITAAQATATAAGVAVAATDIAVAAVAADLVITNAALVVTDANVATNTADIDTLEAKTQTYSYNVGTNIVTIASRLNATSFGDLNFTGDLNQTYQASKNNTLRNPTYFQHNIELQNNKGFLIDAGSSFENNGTTTTNGTLSAAGTFTASGATTNLNSTTTQIGTTSASTLNTYSTSNFYGPTTIRNNSTSSSGTIDPYLNVYSIATNTNARKLNGICVGVESLLANEANCNLGYNYVSSSSANNYGYLGLNIGSFNVYECLRWSPSKVSISNGNLEVTNNSTILGSLTCNTLQNSGATNFAITSTGAANNLVLSSANNLNLFGTGAIKLNSNLVEVGTNQGTAANNVISIGTVNSLSVTNIPNGIKTNYINPYNTAVAVAVNGLQINIGANETTLSLNTINIGSLTAASIINLNGIINTSLPIVSTNIFSQF